MTLSDQPIQVDLFNKGLDSLGQNPLSFSGSGVNAKTASMMEDGVPSNFIQDGDTVVRLNVIDGYLQSDGFITGSTGWQINSNGDAEFNSGIFRGSLSAGTIDIGGADATSFHVDIDGNMWLGNAAFVSAPFRVSNAGAITATGVTVTGSLTTGAGSLIAGTYIDSLSVAKLATGTISSKQVTLAITGGTGDVYFAAGKTDFTNTDAGFILGLDDSDSDKAKFYIGSSTVYFNWDGTNVTVVGGTITGGTVQTASTGYRVKMSSSGLEFLNNDTVQTSLVTDATNSLTLTAGGTIEFDLGDDNQTWFMDSTGFYPHNDKQGSLGSSSKEWGSVYAQSYKTGSETGGTVTLWVAHESGGSADHRIEAVNGLIIH